MIKAVLFDLDGTLLPMDEDAFLKAYIHELKIKYASYGFEPEAIEKAVWAGTRAMAENDGAQTNEAVFWQVFESLMGPAVMEMKPRLLKFYEEEFHRAKTATSHNPKAQKPLDILHAKGIKTVLASNPLFPLVGYVSRLGWTGLEENSFDHITAYEDYHYAKPNQAYYQEILGHLGLEARDCLMVGNDTQMDGAAMAVGMDFYLVTDNLANPQNVDIGQFKHGDFDAMCAYLQSL